MGTSHRKRILGGVFLLASLSAAWLTNMRGGGDPPSALPRPPPKERAPGRRPATSASIAEPTFRIDGLVLDEADLPAREASVTISTDPAQTVRTDAGGSFSFEGPPLRPLALQARRGDQVSAVVYAVPDVAPGLLTLHLSRGAGLEVRVTSALSHAPIEGATVLMSSTVGEIERMKTTQDGRVMFRGLTDGRQTITARAPGFAPASTVVALPIGAQSTGMTAQEALELEPGVSVSGVVLSEAGALVKGATVSAQAVSLRASYFAEAHSTEGGQWSIDALVPGLYTFHATAADLAPGSTDAIDIRGATRDVRLVLRAGATLRGTVVNAAGHPVRGAMVRVASSVYTHGYVRREVTTDGDGEFVVRGLPPQPLTAFAWAGEASSPRFEVDGARPPGAPLKLQLASAAIQGTVVGNEDRPVPGARVFAQGASQAASRDELTEEESVATADGSFLLTGLPPGDYLLYASQPGIERWPIRASPTPARTGSTNVVVFVAGEGTVHGRVVSSDQAAIQRFVVRIEHIPTPYVSPDGTFTLRLGEGAGALSIEAAGYPAKPLPVEVVAGETTDVGTIVLERGRRVEGRVVGPHGEAAPGADVLVGQAIAASALERSADKDLLAMLGAEVTKSDAEGRFSFDGMGSDALELVADHPSLGRSSPMHIAGGTKDIRVTVALASLGAVRGRVLRAGAAIAKSHVAVTAQPTAKDGRVLIAACAPDGTYLLNRIIPGRYRLGVIVDLHPKPAAAVEILVAAKDTLTHDFELGPEGVTVTLELKADGQGRGWVLRGTPKGETYGALGPKFMDGRWFDYDAPPAKSPRLEDLEPGSYSACFLLAEPPVEGGSWDDLPVACAPFTVNPSPSEQTVSITVPGPK
ncbi:MAG: carboxypeptidase-like regulatory domain-containing protein [Myxococcota bacterium]